MGRWPCALQHPLGCPRRRRVRRARARQRGRARRGVRRLLRYVLGAVLRGRVPGLASSIILDSAVPTDADLALEEYLVQDVATQLLQTCVDDPVCGPAVGFESGEASADALLTMPAPNATPAQAELDAGRHVASLTFGTLMTEIQEGWGVLLPIEPAASRSRTLDPASVRNDGSVVAFAPAGVGGARPIGRCDGLARDAERIRVPLRRRACKLQALCAKSGAA